MSEITNVADALATVAEAAGAGAVVIENQVAEPSLTYPEADVAIASINAERDVAIAEINAEARKEEAEAYSEINSTRTLEEKLEWALSQMVVMQTQLAALTAPPIVVVEEPSLSSLEETPAETIAEIAETLEETNSIPISMSEETSLTETGHSESDEGVALEIPLVVVDQKPVRVPIIQLV